MTDRTDQREAIAEALKSFDAQPLPTAARRFFECLGYSSKRSLRLATTKDFLRHFDPDARLTDKEREQLDRLTGLHFIFQLTDAELTQQNELFDDATQTDATRIHSYLFFAAELPPGAYTRTELAALTRTINKPLAMPALILFRHGHTITVAVIHRRLNKRDASREVLEKTTLIKEISLDSPHRAHIDILYELSFQRLCVSRPCDKDVNDFVSLHQAWHKTLDIQTLNKKFFTEIRNWFYWARLHARFPPGARKDADGRDSEAIIRLLTRMIFCWFLREKRLIPDRFFSASMARSLIREWDVAGCDADRDGRYYRAILQNLFFATLATPPRERKFRATRSYQGKNKHYGDQRYFRHVNLFIDKAPVEEIYQSIPFLNGGLFENLDEIPGRDPDVTEEVRVDGFSDIEAKQPTVPDYLFWGEPRPVPELSALLAETSAPAPRGLLRIFADYKFTVEENTPLEEDIALDPELLGRAFENLLASVNPETGTVARKSTGSFYTPREIVHYMAEEALFRFLLSELERGDGVGTGLAERLRELVSEQSPEHHLSTAEQKAVVATISRLRILDPACGSGAFPMGLLHLLVSVLRKVDPNNRHWKAAKLEALPPEMREKAEAVFREESFDYTRKLELIKDCIHGVDIQPSAIQISKLRFFLSLVIEQRDPRSVRPLPNLETKFVCANSLLALQRPSGWDIFQSAIEPRERALLDVRSKYFFAQTKEEKDACKSEDRRLRGELSGFIKDMGGGAAGLLASAIAAWDPYHGERCAGYFDPESMFGVRDGFDITIGNPPYVRADEQSEWNQRQRKQILDSKLYETLWEKWDLYVPFIERSYKLLRPGGISTMIVSDAFCHAKYAQKAQNWFLKNSRILRLDFCGSVEIFDAAVHNLIYFFQRAAGATWKPDRRVHHKIFGEVRLLPTDEQVNLTHRLYFPEDGTVTAFECKSLTLESICYISVGIVAHADEKVAKGEFQLEDLVSHTKDLRHPKPFVEGKHLERWLPAEQRWLEWGTQRSPRLLRRQTFEELYSVPEKVISVDMAAGIEKLRVAYDDAQLFHNHSAWSFVPWHSLHGVRNNSLKKAARYSGEKPPRPDLPKREELEATSRRFSVKYLLGVMNSSTARDFLRANRRSNIHLYPDDWKKLPIPDVEAEAQAPIIETVDRILAAKRKNPAADVSELERQIDERVAALYGVQATTVRATGQGELKERLRTEGLTALSAEKRYFHIREVRAWMAHQQLACGATTVKQYMSEFVAAGFVHDAGKGWYSTIGHSFSVDAKPLKEVVSVLEEKFPLLRFGCWSTEQVRQFAHHTLNKFVTFVYVGKDAMRPAFESLRTAGWNAYLNPGAREVRTVFAVRPKTVVVRDTRAPDALPETHALPIEELLIELHQESKRLPLMDAEDVQTTALRAIESARIDMGRLTSLASDRKLNLADLLGPEYTTPET